MTVQLSPAGEKPRSRWMAGIATVTMLPSRMIISIPAQSTARAVRREWDMRILLLVSVQLGP